MERLWSWCKRNPRVAVLSGTVAGLVVVWAVTSSVLAWQLKQQKDEANYQARIALENETLARKNAEVAKRRFEKTADAMVAVVEQAQLDRVEPSAISAVLDEQRHSPLNLRGRILLAAQGVDVLLREERCQLGPRVLAPELTA